MHAALGSIHLTGALFVWCCFYALAKCTAFTVRSTWTDVCARSNSQWQKQRTAVTQHSVTVSLPTTEHVVTGLALKNGTQQCKI